MSIEVMKQACAALEGVITQIKYYEQASEAIVALNHAIVQAEKQEPVAFIGTDGSLGWLKKPEVIYNKPVPLFKPPSPAVMRQLVDALAGLIDFIEIDNLKIDQDALRIARAALAAAKEAGL